MKRLVRPKRTPLPALMVDDASTKTDHDTGDEDAMRHARQFSYDEESDDEAEEDLIVDENSLGEEHEEE